MQRKVTISMARLALLGVLFTSTMAGSACANNSGSSGQAGSAAGQAGNAGGEAVSAAGQAGNAGGQAGSAVGQPGNAGQAGDVSGQVGNAAGLPETAADPAAGPDLAAQGEPMKVTAVPKVDKPTLPVWDEAATYDFYLGKTEDAGARFFQSPDYQNLLVLPGKGDEVFVIALKAKQVSTLPKSAVTARDDGAVVAAGVEMKKLGAVAQNGADLSFKAGAQEFRVTPEPPLIGETTRDALLRKKGDYAVHVQMYQPKSAAVALLKSVSQPVEIKIFFGTWCSYCKKWLPAFIKTIDTVANPNLHVQYFGVDEAMSEPEAQLTQYQVSRTPTFVVLQNGKEVGRIVEEPKKSIEEDLVLILMGR